MKVLLLTYFFPPDPVVGALRPANVAAALRARGHEVRVVAARTIAERAEASPEDAWVRRVRPLPIARDAYLGLKRTLQRWSGRAGSTPAGHVTEGYIPPKRHPRWKRYVLSLFAILDSRRGFILPAVARSLSGARTGADLVYTSGPPHSVHLAGLLVKMLTGTRWVAEFRDPWSGNPDRSLNVRSELSDRALRRLERFCVSRADHVIVAADAVGAAFSAQLGGDAAQRILCIRNGIPALPATPRPTAQDETFRIVYLGSLGQSRDPRPFLDGLAALRRRGVHGGRPLSVDFYGQCKWYYHVSVPEYAAALGLSNTVHVHDAVPHDEGLDVLREADMLLLLAQEQPAQVPNKLYEYLACRRPILAFADADGETAAILSRVGRGHHLVTESNAERVADILQRAVTHRHEPLAFDEGVLEELSTARQMARLVSVLEQPGHPPHAASNPVVKQGKAVAALAGFEAPARALTEHDSPAA